MVCTVLWLSDCKNSSVILPIVVITSIILGVVSHNYFTLTVNEVQELALSDLETNSEIEVYSISNKLSNSIFFINSNLERIVNSPSILNWNITGIERLLALSQNTTDQLTDGYYLLDRNGTLVTFTGKDQGQNSRYEGINLSHRDYFQIPKRDGELFINTVIDSNDSVPRVFISLPITKNNQTVTPTQVSDLDVANPTRFEGVIVASVAAKTLGNFLESQMHPKFNGDIGFIDRNGTIIYSSDQSFIGVDFFGNDFQSYMKSILKDREEGFNDIINRAMKSENGVQEFKFENSTTTIAYQAVNVPNRDESSTRIGTLFITVPHILSVEVISLIDTLILVNFSIILVIASISLIVAIMLLHWNKILKENVSQKTTQLSESVGKLEQANEDLKTHDKLQREFINIAAHELRTPTQAISGNLDLIEIMHIPSIMQNTGHNENELRKEFQEILEDKEKLADFIRGLQSTYRNSQRLEKLVNDILDTSRIESNQLEIHKERFNLNEKIQNVIKDITKKYNDLDTQNRPGDQVKIVYQQEIDPIPVYADKIRIFEVLSNLLNNAIKFSEGNPINITVEIVPNTQSHEKDSKNQTFVSGRMDDNTPSEMVVVSIIDHGKGIDKDILPRLFTKFVTKSNQGTGLGLYITKSIIEAHKGKIWARNNKDGKGSTFSFSLPLDEM